MDGSTSEPWVTAETVCYKNLPTLNNSTQNLIFKLFDESVETNKPIKRDKWVHPK